MFVVSGSKSTGMVTSDNATLDDALIKAAEYLKAGMLHVGILALDGTTYIEKQIDLVRAEGGRLPQH